MTNIPVCACCIDDGSICSNLPQPCTETLYEPTITIPLSQAYLSYIKLENLSHISGSGYEMV